MLPLTHFIGSNILLTDSIGSSELLTDIAGSCVTIDSQRRQLYYHCLTSITHESHDISSPLQAAMALTKATISNLYINLLPPSCLLLCSFLPTSTSTSTTTIFPYLHFISFRFANVFTETYHKSTKCSSDAIPSLYQLSSSHHQRHPAALLASTAMSTLSDRTALRAKHRHAKRNG